MRGQTKLISLKEMRKKGHKCRANESTPISQITKVSRQQRAFPVRVSENIAKSRDAALTDSPGISPPLTLTSSITRKSSVVVSISSISMMMFGCFTLRRIDTSFSIRCSWGRGFRGEDQTRRNRLCSRVPEDNTGCGPEPAGAQTNHTLGTRRKPTEGLQTALAGLGVLSGL